jgi:hypothetical protein
MPSMATFKRFQPSPVAPDVVRTFPLDQLLDGPRPGPEDPAGDRQWCEARSAVSRLLVGTEYDPRHMQALAGDELAEWRDSRRRWLADRGLR